MPLYEYQCKKCGERFELIQKFSDPPRAKCPQCEATSERLLSAPAIQFKGSGWYVTDYANKSAPDSASDSSNGGGEKAKETAQKGNRPASKENSKKTPSTKT